MDAMPEPGKSAMIAALDLIIKTLEDGLVALEGAKGETEQAVSAERERCAKIVHEGGFDCELDLADMVEGKIREPFDAQDAACEEVADHPNMLTIRLGGTTTISIMDPSAIGLTIEEFCAQWAYPVLEMAGMKHA